MTAKTRRLLGGAVISLLFHGIVAVFRGLVDFSPVPPRPPILTVTLEQGRGGPASGTGKARGFDEAGVCGQSH